MKDDSQESSFEEIIDNKEDEKEVPGEKVTRDDFELEVKAVDIQEQEKISPPTKTYKKENQ